MVAPCEEEVSPSPPAARIQVSIASGSDQPPRPLRVVTARDAPTPHAIAPQPPELSPGTAALGSALALRESSPSPKALEARPVGKRESGEEAQRPRRRQRGRGKGPRHSPSLARAQTASGAAGRPEPRMARRPGHPMVRQRRLLRAPCQDPASLREALPPQRR